MTLTKHVLARDGTRIALGWVLPVLVAGVAVAQQSAAASPSVEGSERLVFAELEKRGLLSENELWVARNLRNREPLGVFADLDGDGGKEIVIAGIRTSKIPGSDPGDLKGFIKIHHAGDAAPAADWEFPGQFLAGLRDVKLEKGAKAQTFAAFADAGSTYGFTLNVFVFSTENGFASLALPSPGGGLTSEDLDGDGVLEVVHQTYFEPEAPVPRVLWFDVLSWSGYGFTEANRRFPKFFRDRIESYYLENLESAKRRGLPESYLASNRRAIAKAERLASTPR